jgi:hypothetical protein
MSQTKTQSPVQHRQLRFQTIEELLAEIDRIESAAQTGELESVGNWTPGQVLAHIAAWVDYGWDGYPVKSPPFFIKWIFVRMAGRIIKRGMKPGAKIPGVREGTFGQEKISVEAGLDRVRRAFGRLQAGEVAKFDSPAFGPLSHEDRTQLNLRHAELHLGFLHY